ncbi:MAG: 3-deoxy-D-manno-octulosonic acid transferase [Hyphomonadaceae bacterium]
MSVSPALAGYRIATALLGPFAPLWLGARARSGKEDGARLKERYGRYDRVRADGRLIWLHAASVGESGVAMLLIEALAARDPELSFLISTGTRTSADLVARRNLARTTHVYAPLDRGDAVKRFLDYWSPDVGVFVESEVWPNLLLAAQRRGVKLALVNARMSPDTLRRWRTWRAAGARVFSAFDFVSAADARTAEALSEVRGRLTPILGNLKLAAPPPRVDQGARDALVSDIAGRPLWLAASTHAGEDEIALAAHAALRKQKPDALLILAPRHPERGEAVAALAGEAPRRSRFQPIGKAPVYVADTLGELGLFYDLAPVALVAGSLLPQLKGHNPIEPAKLDAAILSGPFVESFDDVFSALFAARGAIKVADAEALAAAVERLLSNEVERIGQTAAARRTVEQGADALAVTVAEIARLTPSAEAAQRAANASA